MSGGMFVSRPEMLWRLWLLCSGRLSCLQCNGDSAPAPTVGKSRNAANLVAPDQNLLVHRDGIYLFGLNCFCALSAASVVQVHNHICLFPIIYCL